jgi:hypothetical protein
MLAAIVSEFSLAAVVDAFEPEPSTAMLTWLFTRAAIVVVVFSNATVDMFTASPFAFAADAGATEVKTPKPKAATVTSATRLKVVFVDICFLSISRTREFPSFGFELIS